MIKQKLADSHDEIIRLKDNGFTCEEIGIIYGCHRTYVNKYLRLNGVYYRKPSLKMDELRAQEDRIRHLKVVKCMSNEKIGLLMGASKSSINRICKEKNIPNLDCKKKTHFILNKPTNLLTRAWR